MMLHHQRGFGLLAYGLIALAILGTLAGIGASIFNAGVDHERARQAVRDRQAQDEANKLAAERGRAAMRQADSFAAASAAAREYEARWRRARTAAARSKPIAVIECPSPGVPGDSGGAKARSDADGGVDRGGIRLRLAAEFLRQWDGAWTGQGGEPVFPNSERVTETAAAAVTLDAALDNHVENASRCSEARRQLNHLIDAIERLRSL